MHKVINSSYQYGDLLNERIYYSMIQKKKKKRFENGVYKHFAN